MNTKCTNDLLRGALEALESATSFGLKKARDQAPKLCTEIRAALAAAPAAVQPPILTINGYQLRAALDFNAPEGSADQLESEVCIQHGPARADPDDGTVEPEGLYCWSSDYPEEGAIRLDDEPTSNASYWKSAAADRAALAAQDADRPAEPWNGLKGLPTLRSVIGLLREQGRYVDEEGEATDSLDDLVAWVEKEVTAGAAAPAMPTETPTMPKHWAVIVEADGETLLTIGDDWVSGREPNEQDEQTIIGAAKHLLSFVGYGLPPSAFDPEAAPATEHSSAVAGPGYKSCREDDGRCGLCGGDWSVCGCDGMLRRDAAKQGADHGLR